MRHIYLRVQTGDTLSSLAAVYGTTEDALREANRLALDAPALRAGQVIKVPVAAEPREPVAIASVPAPETAAAPAAAPARAPVGKLSSAPKATIVTAHRSPSPPLSPPSPPSPSQPPPPPPSRAGRQKTGISLPWTPLWSGAAPGAVTHGSPDRQIIALTFEASFGEGSAAAILGELKRAKVQATWFLSGVWVERFRQLAREIAAAGHQVETHAYSHPHLRELNAAEMRRELERAVAAVASATKRQPRWLRPPFGAHNKALLQVASKLGLGVVLWSFDSLDWQNPGAAFVADRMAALVEPGAIVHMHASADQAPAALRRAIPRLRAMGYEFGTLDEVVKEGASAK